ncbi:hypothetical protein [Paenibacillus sp. 1P07SE]|uniref:hypothetical protein n=1 Tax=Paenibacillus sp. 1P07SE TaxID=3132209 RepID=UPI0039A6BEBC
MIPSEKRAIGRPAEGITKKKSLTLTESEWAIVEQYDTIAAFVKAALKPQLATQATTLHPSDNRQFADYPKHEVDSCWKTYLRFSEDPPPSEEVIEQAQEAMYRVLYPNGSEQPAVEVKAQYICPFSGKRFGSVHKMVQAAIPRLLQSTEAMLKMKAERERRG